MSVSASAVEGSTSASSRDPPPTAQVPTPEVCEGVLHRARESNSKVTLPTTAADSAVDNGVSTTVTPADVNKTDDDEQELSLCSICICDIEEGEEIFVSPKCGHKFHRLCAVESIVKTGKRCPMCRGKIDWKKLGPTCEEINSVDGDKIVEFGVGGFCKRYIFHGTRYKTQEKGVAMSMKNILQK